MTTNFKPLSLTLMHHNLRTQKNLNCSSLKIVIPSFQDQCHSSKWWPLSRLEHTQIKTFYPLKSLYECSLLPFCNWIGMKDFIFVFHRWKFLNSFRKFENTMNFLRKKWRKIILNTKCTWKIWNFHQRCLL